MPQFIEGVPRSGDPIRVTVTVKTGDGESTKESAVGQTVSNMEDAVAYSAAKAAQRAFRSIMWDLVKQKRPALNVQDREFGLIWRATLHGRTLTIKTAEEITAENAQLVKETSGRRYHLRCVGLQLYYAWTGVYMAIYEAWKVIRG